MGPPTWPPPYPGVPPPGQPGYPPPGQYRPGYGPSYYPPPGFYPPGLAPVYAAPKKSDTSTIVVVVVILVVFMFVVPVFYMLIAARGPPATPTAPTMVLQSTNRWSTADNVSSYAFSIASVSPNPFSLGPQDLSYVASTRQGETLYAGLANQNTSSSGYAVNLAYNDLLDAGRVSPGDRIVISVTPAQGNPLFGGDLRVFADGNAVSTGRM